MYVLQSLESISIFLESCLVQTQVAYGALQHFVMNARFPKSLKMQRIAIFYGSANLEFNEKTTAFIQSTSGRYRLHRKF